MQPITLLITDDHRLLRESLFKMFNTDCRFQVLGQCATGEEAVVAVQQLNPDILLIDINMPGMGGMEACRQIAKKCPATKIISLSIHTAPIIARQLLRCGVSGYISKNSSSQELIRAVIEIYGGNKYICREVKTILANHMLESDDPYSNYQKLSDREIEICALLQKGLNSREIGSELQIAARTVDVHRSGILKKLGVTNVAAAINYVSKIQFMPV